MKITEKLKNKILTAVISALIVAGSVITFAAIEPSHFSVQAPAPKAVELDLTAKTVPAKDVKVSTTAPANAAEYILASPLEIVASTDKYLNKKVKFTATFDKFSTLGLDYKPAFRDSQKYITFLIKRDDVTDHTIPLSEMKIFIKRTDAEKFIDLDSGDIIQVYGKVFSNALTDTWVDVDKLVLIEKKNKDVKKKA